MGNLMITDFFGVGLDLFLLGGMDIIFALVLHKTDLYFLGMDGSLVISHGFYM